jgi:HEAT repeat protein/beta-lactamase regulating signal transducer with metallopeptidase domain
VNQLTTLFGSADAWLLSLAVTTLRLSVILIAAAVIAMSLRRSSASLRHVVWALALGAALLLPVGVSHLPHLDLPIPGRLLALARSPADSAPGIGTAEVSLASQTPDKRLEGGAGAGLEDSGVLADVVTGAEDRQATMTLSAVARTSFDSSARPASGAQALPRGRAGMALSWQQLTLGLWVAGIVILLFRIGVGIFATRRIGRHATRPRDRDGEWETLVVELARRIGLTRPVRILSSGHTSVPVTWGWARPVVLVPESGATWSAARKRVVLLHELNHVKRQDCASQLMAQIACAVYWFNPLVWLASRALRIERERACDEAVVLDGTQPSSYADHLLEIARAHRGARWSPLAAVAMARPSQLEGRLLSILKAGTPSRPSRRTVLALGAFMGAVVLILTAVTPTTSAAIPVPRPLTTIATEVSLDDVAPTASTVAAAEQAPAPASPRTPDADRLAARAQAPRAAAEAQALAELAEFERRLEEMRDRRSQNVLIEQQDVQRAVERAQREVEREMRFVIDDVRVAEDVRERLELELSGIRGQASVRDARRALDPRVAELFIESLSDDDAGVREQAARGLGRNRVEAAVGPLSNALEDDNAEVRERAAWALGMIRSDGAVGPLSGALDDAEPSVAEQAAWALGMIRSDVAVDPLLGALEAENPDVREQAAWALGMIRSPSAVQRLGAALDDADLGVRTEVVEALGRIRDVSAVEPLVGALRDSEPRIRREAAESLGRIRDAGAVNGLVTALGDAEPVVAEHAAEALGLIRAASAVDGLVGALRHEHPDVVAQAAEALGRIRSDAAVDGLVAALRTAEGDVAGEIVEALGRIGSDRALDTLIDMTGDATPDVRRAVIEALSGRQWSRPNPTPNPSTNPNPEPE